MNNGYFFLLKATIILDCAVRFNNGGQVNNQNFAIRFVLENIKLALNRLLRSKVADNFLFKTKQKEATLCSSIFSYGIWSRI